MTIFAVPLSAGSRNEPQGNRVIDSINLEEIRRSPFPPCDWEALLFPERAKEGKKRRGQGGEQTKKKRTGRFSIRPSLCLSLLLSMTMTMFLGMHKGWNSHLSLYQNPVKKLLITTLEVTRRLKLETSKRRNRQYSGAAENFNILIKDDGNECGFFS